MFLSNLFLALCVWIVLPILYATMRNNTICKKNIILSVTLPPAVQQDEEVLACCAAFRKGLLRLCLWLTAALVPAVLLPWSSISVTWSMLWMTAAIAVPYRYYGAYNKRLKAIKQRRGWVIPTAEQAEVPAAALKLPKPVKFIWFLLPMVLSVLPVISCFADQWDAAWRQLLIITALTGLFVTVTAFASFLLVFRQKADAMDGDHDRTAALTRVRRYNWTKCCLLLSWLTAGYSLAVWCCQGSILAYLVWTILYAIAVVAASLTTEFAARRAQHRLNSDLQPIADEDDRWIWGQFYYNPDSKKLTVAERVGTGISFNYATPVGKAVAVFSILVLLACPLMGGWLMVEEFSPIRMEETEQTLTVTHGFSSYAIDLTAVESVEVLEALPDCSRVWGTGMENLLKGAFTVEGYGSATLCLNPKKPPFQVWKTANGVYILNQ